MDNELEGCAVVIGCVVLVILGAAAFAAAYAMGWLG